MPIKGVTQFADVVIDIPEFLLSSELLLIRRISLVWLLWITFDIFYMHCFPHRLSGSVFYAQVRFRWYSLQQSSLRFLADSTCCYRLLHISLAPTEFALLTLRHISMPFFILQLFNCEPDSWDGPVTPIACYQTSISCSDEIVFKIAIYHVV